MCLRGKATWCLLSKEVDVEAEMFLFREMDKQIFFEEKSVDLLYRDTVTVLEKANLEHRYSFEHAAKLLEL